MSYDRGLDSVRVDKGELLATIKKNREDHHMLITDLQVKYREMAIIELQKRLDSLRRNNKVDLNFPNLPVPVSHLDEYDSAIRKLEMCVDSTVTLTNQQFETLVQDKWHWLHTILTQSTLYSVDNSASRKYRGLAE